MDLEAILAGQPPLQARQQIKASLLKGLAGEAEEKKETETVEAGEPVAQSSLARNGTAVIVILSAALAVSIILNIFLLATMR
jgi:hypothetical protein